jgi:hypothetical protein
LKRMLNRTPREARVSAGLLIGLWLTLSAPASGHNRPPFPIIENRKVGPCIVAVWTHPDVGAGAFYVFVEPAPGDRVPNDLPIETGVQPATGRLPERFYDAWRVKSHGPVQYNAQAEIDRQELWRVHLVLQSSQGGGEATVPVAVTPPGSGRSGPFDISLTVSPRGRLVVPRYCTRKAAQEGTVGGGESRNQHRTDGSRCGPCQLRCQLTMRFVECYFRGGWF